MTAEPQVGRHPTEIFGYPYVDRGDDAAQALAGQHCPFLDDICKKPRKSEPEVKVGVCSLGYRGRFLEAFRPIIVCPHRFLANNEVFSAIEGLYLPDAVGAVEWVSEVSLGVGGSVDYVGVKRDAGGQAVEDFVCVEFQAAGTTGTPWAAVQEFKANRAFSRTSYPYGINWANEFLKTMMQQVYKKGRVVESWGNGKKLVFVVQDVAIEYLRSVVDTSGLRDASDEDAIHFVTFRMEWDADAGRWRLAYHSALSTDTEGINRIIAGAETREFPSEADFRDNIYAKGVRSGVF